MSVNVTAIAIQLSESRNAVTLTRNYEFRSYGRDPTMTAVFLLAGFFQEYRFDIYIYNRNNRVTIVIK